MTGEERPNSQSMRGGAAGAGGDGAAVRAMLRVVQKHADALRNLRRQDVLEGTGV